MQAGTGDQSFLYTCYDCLKNAVMGCCYSICNNDPNPQETIVNERTRLLEVPEHQQEAPVRTATVSMVPRKPDEQSSLNRILQETATNVIDVGALGPYPLESTVYNERVRAYTARLAAAPPGFVVPMHHLLKDVPQSDRNQLLSKPGLLNEDKELITNAVKKVAAAMSELRVEHHEDLVVPFRVP